MRICTICGKRPVNAKTATYRGMLKRDGGVGRKTVRVSNRRFLPNLQPTRLLVKGTVRRVLVCTSCIKSGRAPVAPRPSARRGSTAPAPAA